MNTGTPQAHEQISALLDNELSAQELRHFLAHHTARGEQHAAQRTLQRYARLSALMRDDADAALIQSSRDVVSSVMQRIASEPMPRDTASQAAQAPAPRNPGWGHVLAGWRAPALSMALAASIAAAFLVFNPQPAVTPNAGVLTAQHGTTQPVTSPASNASPTTAPAVTLAELESAGDAMPDPYLLHHLTQAEGGPMRSLSSNVRLASYERP